MTVSTTTRRIIYTGSGASAYAYPFKIFANGDLLVTVDGVVQVLTTNYTVSGAGDTGGGNVTFLASVSGKAIVIVRRLTATQSTDYTAGDSLPAESLEDALDRAVMLLQQMGFSACERFGATTATAASAGATADTVYTWPVAFADANYTVVASGFGPTGAPILTIQSKTASTVTVRVIAATAVAASFTAVHMVAVRD